MYVASDVNNAIPAASVMNILIMIDAKNIVLNANPVISIVLSLVDMDITSS